MDSTSLSNVQRIEDYNELKPGDYVVHEDCGIGKYLGIKTIRIRHTHPQRYKDYLVIAYRRSTRIYVPINKIDLVKKYVSAGERHPRLSDLDSKAWHRTKSHTYHKVQGIANGLVKLYAERSKEQGYAFPKDDDVQRKFEAAFPYKLTPDQARSIKEIKLDMEKPHPMDRLLIGDVGYGKTEVAFRAAFKAIEAQMQVAILVPTTILAAQHCSNLLKRMAGFPISISLLSRFSTKEQTQRTLNEMKNGLTDIIVGTHRMLSSDVKFTNLGFLIVDEEQRFGVKAKNRIKKKYPKTDVLTLSATPIPRTLNMAMMGVRDLSIIETPPIDRLPIVTKVVPEHDRIIKQGIEREMARNGQVFFLHNRVKDMDSMVLKLKQLVPKARIAYIDGVMDKTQSEQILIDFMNHKFDVLITTTIIETGIDIANANTLFIENADRMGLSQLYQLRGRVGRGSRQAYAYLMYRPNKVVNETSQKRLETMKKFNDLGSGFRIAMRDLTLRRAGTLLGTEQHGFINSVGYNMYTKMLSQAVSKKQGHDLESFVPADIKLGLDAYVPSDYIHSQKDKLDLYRRLDQATNDNQLKSLRYNTVKEFGKRPKPVRALFLVSKLHYITSRAGISEICRLNDRLTVCIPPKIAEKLDKQQLIDLVPDDSDKPVRFKSVGKEIDIDIENKASIDEDFGGIRIIEYIARELKETLKRTRKTDKK